MKTVILVGTETGNSLDFATRLSEDFERLSLENELFLIDEFPLEKFLEESLEMVIFVCSTTGDGEEPGHMRSFMKFLLRADLPADLFTGIKFAVFGLGDSSYEKFNFVGKRVYRRMRQLGGRDLVGFRGEGDERHLPSGIEFGWSLWYEALKSKLNITKDFKELDNDNFLLPPRCTLKINEESAIYQLNSYTINMPLTCSCRIIGNMRITPEDHFQDTRLLKFQMKSEGFQPGDILNLKPTNEHENVEELINLMEWNGDLPVYGIEGKLSRNWLQYTKNNDYFPVSLKQFIIDNVDISRIPSKSILKKLSCLSNLTAAEYSPMHRDKLIELSKDEGEYLDYVWRPKRSILEILKDFQPTIKIKVDRILQVFQPIKPRQFSIANNVQEKEGTVELLVALVKEPLKRGGFREGLCSKWIKSDRIQFDLTSAFISHGSLNPSIFKEIIFLFAAGTGIAPLRSIIQRFRDKTIFLYFGCRSVEKDFYFKKEWSNYDNLTVFVAGSRDGDEGKSRLYLDDIIKSNSSPLKAIKTPEYVSCIVAGHSRLNKLVQLALNQIWIDNFFHGMTWVEWLKSHGQYQTETWS